MVIRERIHDNKNRDNFTDGFRTTTSVQVTSVLHRQNVSALPEAKVGMTSQ